MAQKGFGERFFSALIVLIMGLVLCVAFMQTIFTVITALFSDTFVIAIIQFSTLTVMLLFTFYYPYRIMTSED